MRLAKYLAHAGVASRRAAEKLIGDGRVAVDGQTVTDPALAVDASRRVTVDGRPLEGPEPRVVYAVHKPVGVVSTARDTHGRPTVVGLVRSRGLRLYPVGRLDADSSGLILLTNDGELANRLTHPSFEMPKTYRVKLGGGPPGAEVLEALRRGVPLDGSPTSPALVRRLRSGVIEITIHEGRNRQVRRMCEALGHPVLELERIAFGPLQLGDLQPGAYRRLRAAEVERLRAL
ncbi:MAG TPA: pseudouridine synthase [Solirubrobacteraceae bacterium]|jgi:23S rRNA pseudouridine2605 synthase|nr:pseudouridine synthase [Solirubrobacteraceae bacterium]